MLYLITGAQFLYKVFVVFSMERILITRSVLSKLSETREQFQFESVFSWYQHTRKFVKAGVRNQPTADTETHARARTFIPNSSSFLIKPVSGICRCGDFCARVDHMMNTFSA